MAEPSSDIVLWGLTRDILGAIGVALMTLLLSSLGWLIASRWTQRKIAKDLKRQKLEAFCIAIQDAIFHVANLQRTDLPPERFIEKTAEKEAHEASLDRALQQAHTYKMLYLSGHFDESYSRVIRASRIIRVNEGVAGYSRSNVLDLLVALNGLISEVWQEFKVIVN